MTTASANVCVRVPLPPTATTRLGEKGEKCGSDAATSDDENDNGVSEAKQKGALPPQHPSSSSCNESGRKKERKKEWGLEEASNGAEGEGEGKRGENTRSALTEERGK